MKHLGTVEQFDCYDAIYDITRTSFDIINAIQLPDDNKLLVHTTIGRFICESHEDANDNIFMDVCRLHIDEKE